MTPQFGDLYEIMAGGGAGTVLVVVGDQESFPLDAPCIPVMLVEAAGHYLPDPDRGLYWFDAEAFDVGGRYVGALRQIADD